MSLCYHSFPFLLHSQRLVSLENFIQILSWRHRYTKVGLGTTFSNHISNSTLGSLFSNQTLSLNSNLTLWYFHSVQITYSAQWYFPTTKIIYCVIFPQLKSHTMVFFPQKSHTMVFFPQLKSHTMIFSPQLKSHTIETIPIPVCTLKDTQPLLLLLTRFSVCQIVYLPNTILL